MAITDIFFDLDHTLWDFDTNSEKAFQRIFEQQHSDVDLQKFTKAYLPINHACWHLYQFDKITHNELRYQRLKQTFDAIGYTISDDAIELVAQLYIDYLPENNHLFEGVHEILTYLKPKYKLHIITNGFAEVQHRKMKNANLLDYFVTITDSCKAGVKKPNPMIFDYALQLAKANKHSSIMIGDSVEADVKGAVDFGMDAIFFNPECIQGHTDFKQINHLLELKKIL